MLSFGNGIKTYFNNTMNSYVNPSVIEVSMNEDEDVKAIFLKKVKMEYLSTYINIDKMNEYLEEARIESTKKKAGNPEQSESEEY